MNEPAESVGNRSWAPITLILVLVIAFASGCGSEDPRSEQTARAKTEHTQPAPATSGGGPAVTSRTSVTLLLNWFPEIEHAGYYEALVRGYYEDRGLDVRIQAGGPNTAVVPRVATGQVEFGIENADGVLFGRAEGAEVVALMAPLQTSPRCIMVHESSEFTSLDQLQGVTLAMESQGAFSHFLRQTLPLRDVKIVPYNGSVSQFLIDPSYAQQGYVFSEPIVAASQGGDPQVFLVADLGFNPYASLLVATDATVRERPEVVRRFVEASVRGWSTYFEDPAPTNAYIHELNPEMPMDVLEGGLESLRPLVHTSESERQGLGSMSGERWRQLHEQMIDLTLLRPGAVDPERAFTIAFLRGNPSDSTEP